MQSANWHLLRFIFFNQFCWPKPQFLMRSLFCINVIPLNVLKTSATKEVFVLKSLFLIISVQKETNRPITKQYCFIFARFLTLLFKARDHAWNGCIIKGQLISECLLGVIDFPKNQRKICQISALESKKGSNEQSKSTFL